MKHILLVVGIIFCITSSLFAADGDTLVIQSHQETHWSWNGRYQDTVQFPTTGSFQKIRMHYVLGCPSSGCSQWDYKTNIELWRIINDSTVDEFEIARVITPYAGDKSNGWFHEYIIDVTDYAPLLKGEQIIMAYYGGFQDGFTISIWFEFIEGTPPRDIVNVQKIYRSGAGGFLYGDASDPIESHLSGKTMNLNSDTKGAKFRLVATGHGFGNDASNGNPDNCAEFCPKWFKLNVDNTERYSETVWNDDCGAEANVAQTGTWIYNRAGWCPGSEAQIFDHELTPYLNGNSVSLNVDWQPYTYTGGSGFPIHYWLESQLFEYGDYNYETEAEITQVLRPTDYDRQSKYNPTCANPIVEVRNNGSNTITQIAIRYGVVGGTSFENEFQVDLDFGETEELEIPIPPENFYKGSGTKFFAEISQVNSSLDENNTNNRVESNFEIVPRLHDSIELQFRSNNNPSENTYYLVNTAGDTIINRTSLTANTQYYDTLALAKGCYTLHITDAGGDGLSWWANPSQGSGSVRLSNIGLATTDSIFIESIDSDFGSFTTYRFTVDYYMNSGNDDYDITSWDPPSPPDSITPPDTVTSVPEWENLVNPYFEIFPNPTKGDAQLELIGYRGSFTVELFDLTGKQVLVANAYSDGLHPIQINTQALPNGIYQARVNVGDHYFHQKLIKQ